MVKKTPFEFGLYPWWAITANPFFLDKATTKKDPWDKRETWRRAPNFALRNRFKAGFPGFGIAATVFAGYLAWETYYYQFGPGKVENDRWERWLNWRNAKLEKEHGGHHH